MSRRCVLADDNGVELSLMVRWDIERVLRYIRSRPCCRNEWFLQPAQPFVVPRVQITYALAVQRRDRIEDHSHVLLLAEAKKAAAPIATAVVKDETGASSFVVPVDRVV